MDADRDALALVTACHDGDGALLITHAARCTGDQFVPTTVRLWSAISQFQQAAGMPPAALTDSLRDHGGGHLVGYASVADCPPLLAMAADTHADAPLSVQVCVLSSSAQVCHEMLMAAADRAGQAPEALMRRWGLAAT